MLPSQCLIYAIKNNVWIIGIYQVPGNGKVLTDAITSFGIKSSSRMGIVADDYWFQNRSEIREYLSSQCNSGMS